MAKHTELTNLPVSPGKHRLCLDRVERDDEDGRFEYSLVWRGTSASPDGFVQRPAYFTFARLGRLLREAAMDSQIPREEVDEFLHNLLGLTPCNQNAV